MSSVLRRIRGLRTFVGVYPVSAKEIDKMLATSWSDPEDALLHESALDMQADCIITRNLADFEGALVKVFDCEGFFAWMLSEYGRDYAIVDI